MTDEVGRTSQAGGRTVVGVVLAAGQSQRTGFPKALATLEGESFVARAVRLLREGGCRYVVVVVAPPHDAAIERAVRGADVVRNPAPELGMLSSLQVGIRRALELAPQAAGVVFQPVDLPLVRISTIAELVSALYRTGAPVIRPTWSGRGGHPVVIGRAAAIAVSSSRAASTRDALAEAGSMLDVEIDDPGAHRDFDTLEELLGAGAEPPEK